MKYITNRFRTLLVFAPMVLLTFVNAQSGGIEYPQDSVVGFRCKPIYGPRVIGLTTPHDGNVATIPAGYHCNPYPDRLYDKNTLTIGIDIDKQGYENNPDSNSLSISNYCIIGGLPIRDRDRYNVHTYASYVLTGRDVGVDTDIANFTVEEDRVRYEKHLDDMRRYIAGLIKSCMRAEVNVATGDEAPTYDEVAYVGDSIIKPLKTYFQPLKKQEEGLNVKPVNHGTVTGSGSGNAQSKGVAHSGVESSNTSAGGGLTTTGGYQHKQQGISCVVESEKTEAAVGHTTLVDVDCGKNPYAETGNHMHITVDVTDGRGNGNSAYDDKMTVIYSCYKGVRAAYKNRRYELARPGIINGVTVGSAEYRDEYRKRYYDRLRHYIMAGEIKGCVSDSGTATATEADEAHIDSVIIEPIEAHFLHSSGYREYSDKTQKEDNKDGGDGNNKAQSNQEQSSTSRGDTAVAVSGTSSGYGGYSQNDNRVVTKNQQQHSRGFICELEGEGGEAPYGYTTLTDVSCVKEGPRVEAGGYLMHVTVYTTDGSKRDGVRDNEVTINYSCYRGVRKVYKDRRYRLRGPSNIGGVTVGSVEYRNEYERYYDALRRYLAREIKSCVAGGGTVTATEAEEEHVNSVIIKPNKKYIESSEYREYSDKTQEEDDKDGGKGNNKTQRDPAQSSQEQSSIPRGGTEAAVSGTISDYGGYSRNDNRVTAVNQQQHSREVNCTPVGLTAVNGGENTVVSAVCRSTDSGSGSYAEVKVDVKVNKGGDASSLFYRDVYLEYSCHRKGVVNKYTGESRDMDYNQEFTIAGPGVDFYKIGGNMDTQSERYWEAYRKCYEDRLDVAMTQISNCVKPKQSLRVGDEDKAHIDSVIIKPSEAHFLSPRNYSGVTGVVVDGVKTGPWGTERWGIAGSKSIDEVIESIKRKDAERSSGITSVNDGTSTGREWNRGWAGTGANSSGRSNWGWSGIGRGSSRGWNKGWGRTGTNGSGGNNGRVGTSTSRRVLYPA